jgi:uncharacterized protein (DUF1800 family)
MAFALSAAKRRKKRRKKRRPAAPKPVLTAPKPPSAPAPTAPTPTTPAPAATQVPVPTSRERLFLNRLGMGYTPAALAALRATGTPEDWLAAQLDPSSVPESPKVAAVDSWFGPLFDTPAAKYAADQAKTRGAWQYGLDLGNWTTLRQMYSNRTLLERMTAIWSTLLHIPIGHDRAWVYRKDYDASIRRLALGRFEDLLVECSLHPAMRVYLDNWKSVRGAPNENQGRELLELHTVGRGAGYTEAMVKDSAKILSGYTVTWGGTFAAWYDPNKHTTGPVSVLGFSDANGAADGQSVTVAYLKHLAHHPSTARRVVTRLATCLVSDSPSDGLLDALTQVYLDNDTAIAPVLEALAAHPEFLTSEGQKVRTPYDDLVASARVLQVDVQAPTSGSSWANASVWLHGADRMFSWPRPDGAPVTSAAWASPSRLFSSYDMHQSLAGGWWPTEAVTYKKSGAQWLPATSIRFDAWVDHLCRSWLGRPADARLLTAAITAINGTQTWSSVSATSTITATHHAATWDFWRLTVALLDTPDHMTT